MEIGINDLYDDDDMNEPIQLLDIQLEEQPIQLQKELNDDFMLDFLKSRGIEDPSKIKFEGENDQIIERNWNDLSKEEKLNILNTPLTIQEENVDNNLLTNDEIELLNNIRRSNLTPIEYIQQIQQQLPTLYLYKIDDLSDDELFILDLESRVGELTDDEAALMLNNAKLNEDLYKKLVEGIRKEYKEREDYQNLLEQAALELELQESYNNFLKGIIDSIDNFDSVGNLSLNFDDSDKEELAEFILSKDESGNNYLWQALQDPETLVKAAWFILNGDEAFNNISDYFVNLIKLVSLNQYNKGLEDGKNNKQTSNSTVYIDTSKKTIDHPKYTTIDDLDD